MDLHSDPLIYQDLYPAFTGSSSDFEPTRERLWLNSVCCREANGDGGLNSEVRASTQACCEHHRLPSGVPASSGPTNACIVDKIAILVRLGVVPVHLCGRD